MYMAPIVRAKAPVSVAKRRLTGVLVVPLALIGMLPFLAGYALYATLVLSVHGMTKLPHALVEMVDYGGRAILGD